MNAALKSALMALLAAGLAANSALAQTTSAAGNGTNAPTTTSTTPVVVGKSNVPIPTDLKGLINKFNKERGAYLLQQKDLLAELEKATTPQERAAIRAQLQQNRDEFLADLKQYRQDLKQQIAQLKDTLNNAEINRLIEEVKQAESDKPGKHHGKT